MANVLVTGGAGFIGSHTVEALLGEGHDVVVLDTRRPSRSSDARWVEGDVREPAAVAVAMEGVTHVLHLAAALGVGQSMVEVARHTDVNGTGLAVVLEAVIAARERIERVVVASSMSIYGEGAYRCERCGPILDSVTRSAGASSFDPPCPRCQGALAAIPTDESKRAEPGSIYAITKHTQELAALAVGRAYAIPTAALRYFNVYGPGQQLSNPYTGVAAIFCTRLLNGKQPFVYEDGLQTRDFVHVSDVARANVLALFAPRDVGGVFNIGSGETRSVLDLAWSITRKLRPDLEPAIGNELRAGDVRHCSADTRRARALLGFEARARFEEKLDELVESVRRAAPPADDFDAHRRDLKARGLAA